MKNLMKDPLINSIICGIIIYLLITISNKGNPVLGAILSSLPIGLLGLLAITKTNNIQNFYIKSEIFTNLTIIIMWLVINLFIYYNYEITEKIIFIAFMIWLILSIIFYYYATDIFNHLIL